MLEAIGAIGTILAVAKGMLGLRSELSESAQENRDQIADYLEKIGMLLADVADRMEHGKPAGDTCGQLEGYRDQLAEVLTAKVLRRTKTDDLFQGEMRLAQLVNGLHFVGRLWDSGQSLESRVQNPINQQDLANLYEAAGIFTSLSSSVRATR